MWRLTKLGHFLLVKGKFSYDSANKKQLQETRASSRLSCQTNSADNSKYLWYCDVDKTNKWYGPYHTRKKLVSSHFEVQLSPYSSALGDYRKFPRNYSPSSSFSKIAFCHG